MIVILLALYHILGYYLKSISMLLAGIDMLFKLLHPWNVPKSIILIVSGIIL